MNDPVLARIIEEVGPCTLKLERDHFKALAESIIYQQLSGKAASTIVKRFMALYPKRSFPTPKDILRTKDEKLRSVGISPQKLRYLKDLSQKFSDGTIDTSNFKRMSDEEIIDHLIQGKGIGRWTAEMFLIFSLGRPDVLPVDDLGIQKAIKELYRLHKMPSPDKMRKIGKKWEPYRTVATWYLWRSQDIVTLAQ